MLFLQTVTREFNVNPNKTTFGGNCSTTLATLSLSSENLLLLVLQFVMVRAPPPLPSLGDPWPRSSGEAPPCLRDPWPPSPRPSAETSQYVGALQGPG